jgi:hypothetical protein
MIRTYLLTGLILGTLAYAQEAIPAFQRVSGLPHAVALRRIPVDAQGDLVVALASSTVCQQAPRPCWWGTKDRLGILLQQRANPEQVQSLAIEPGPNNDCSTRVERFTTQELVLSCVGEKWISYDNQKFVYDLAAHRLVSHSSYPPFSTKGVLHGVGGPQFVMTDGQRSLLVTIDPGSGEPRVTPTAEVPEPSGGSAISVGRFHLTKQKNKYGSEYPVLTDGQHVYELAQTDAETFRRARPDDAAPTNGSSPIQLDPAERNEEIGPHQVEGTRLWFGKSFYNSEGLSGVGGFGYFDTATASFRLFAPPEIYRWSCSAILVEADAVWLALYRRGEYGNDPGGLLRWDRNTTTVQHWDMPWIATSLARSGDGIYMGATNGIALLRDGQITSYFVDRLASGRYQMAPR